MVRGSAGGLGQPWSKLVAREERGNSRGGHYSIRQAIFENCIPLVGCWVSKYPYVKIWVTALGGWSYETGGSIVSVSHGYRLGARLWLFGVVLVVLLVVALIVQAGIQLDPGGATGR